MALARVEFFSHSLFRITELTVVIPNDFDPEMTKQYPEAYARAPKLLVLLHGYTGNTGAWLSGGLITDLAQKYNLYVVCPQGENSFYTDHKREGGKYCQFVGDEVVRYAKKTFGLPDDTETIIGGMSMGGFGAIHVGLAYPETFSKIFALSSALIIHNIDHMKSGTVDTIGASKDYYQDVFGDLDKVVESENNPEVQLLELQKNGTKIPSMYLACGSEDFLHEENMTFVSFMKQHGIDFTYEEDHGIHDFKFWNPFADRAMESLLSK